MCSGPKGLAVRSRRKPRAGWRLRAIGPIVCAGKQAIRPTLRGFGIASRRIRRLFFLSLATLLCDYDD